MRIVGRSWRIVVVCMLIGLAVAGAYLASVLPRYHATAVVLLPPSSSAVPGTSASTARPVTTDAKVATSAAVLLPAARRLDPTASLSQLQSRVKATAVASGVLEISATGSSRRQAERLANEVATRLVAFVTTNGSAANSSVIAGLEAEEKQLGKQFGDIRGEVAATTQRIATEGDSSPAGTEDRALLADLTSQEASVNLQINSVKSQIAAAQLGQLSANLGTEVIQRATTATPPSKTSLALPLVAGLLGGALVGSVLALAGNRARPRVWSRDGLAMAIGAPVALSLDVKQRRSLGDWVQLLESHEPGPLEQWNVLKALRELGLAPGTRHSLTVLAFERDGAAVTEAVLVAVTAAASGVTTDLSVVAPDGAADTLQAVCARYGRQGQRPRQRLTVHDRPLDPGVQTADLAVTLLVVDMENPAGSLAASLTGGACLFSISAGFASPGDLARAGMAATAAGLPIRAVCVANPEAHDATVGRFASIGSTRSLVEHRRLRHTAGT